MPTVKKINHLSIYLVIVLLGFIFMVLFHSTNKVNIYSVGTFPESAEIVRGVSTQYLPEVLVDTYGPPLRNDRPPLLVDVCHGYPRNSTDIRGALSVPNTVFIQENMSECAVPINIETRGIPREFTQVGLLTSKDPMNGVLSLFGRQLMTSGDKWQYYTLSNSGIMPTRLPILVKQNGSKWKDAMYEYGVDRLYSDDVVEIEALHQTYVVQIYEPRQYRYLHA